MQIVLPQSLVFAYNYGPFGKWKEIITQSKPTIGGKHCATINKAIAHIFQCSLPHKISLACKNLTQQLQKFSKLFPFNHNYKIQSTGIYLQKRGEKEKSEELTREILRLLRSEPRRESTGRMCVMIDHCLLRRFLTSIN